MLEVQGNGWFDSFIETAAYKRLEEPTSYLGWISRKIILLVDDIFAMFSSAYKKKRTEISNQIKLIHAQPAPEHPLQKPQTQAKNAGIIPKSVGGLEPEKSSVYLDTYIKSNIELEEEIEEENQVQEVAEIEQDLAADNSKEMVNQDKLIQPLQNPDAGTHFSAEEEAIKGFIESEFSDDDILLAMEDSLSREDCLSIIAKLRTDKPKSQMGFDLLPKEILDLHALSAAPVAPSEPNLILSAMSGPDSSNISFSSSFLASEQKTSPQMITDIIVNNNLPNDTCNNNISTWISQYGLKMLPKNPWDFQEGIGQTMYVSCNQTDRNGIHMAVKILVENAGIKGAIISWNNITTAIRKKEDTIEFFDPSGDIKISGSGRPAYVKVFSKAQQEDLIKLLLIKYSSAHKEDLLEIFPIS